MGPTRYPYGIARGFVNQFNYRGTTAGDISGSATPNVTLGDLFYTNNATSTVITNFVLDDTANRLVNYEGKVINVVFLDANTQVDNAGALNLVGTNNLLGANNSLTLRYSRGSWYEEGRAVVNRNEGATVNIGGATTSINLDGRYGLVVLNATGGATQVIQGISGGQIGQSTLLINRSGGANVGINSAGNVYIAATDAVTLLSNMVYTVVKVSSSRWVLQRNNLFV